ncbi:MAG: response regulator, partial [Elainellaceae cyanobacterium]
QVQISDTGQGIEPSLLPHVFDRFRQADSSDTRRESGLGLGLFLVHSIVEAHDGTVEAHSAGNNQGTTFTVTLPKIVGESSLAPVPSVPTSDPALVLNGIRILVVEDTPENMLLFSIVLHQAGAIVSEAQTAAAALDILTRQPQDLLISDIGMPDVNGYELMQQVRSLPADQNGEILAIALTGYVSEQDIQAAMAAGFQRFLAKPVFPTDLLDMASSLVNG